MAMKAKLLPITGIGSLPFEDIEEAIRFSLKFDIPFLPELTKLEDSTKISSINNFLCFSSFIERVKEIPLYKTQSFLDINSSINHNQVHFIDDPAKAFNKTNIKYGLHCCNNITIQEIDDLNISHLSFDAQLISNPETFLPALIERGITPVVGVINTSDEKHGICSNYDRWRPLLRKYVMNCWISPACGLSNFSIQEVENILEQLREVQREIIISHS